MIVGIGVDIVEVARVDKLLVNQKDRFLKKVFSEGEIAYCLSYSDSAKHLAGRFAVKEAVLKALGTGWTRGIAWHHIEVAVGRRNRPYLKLHFEALRRANELGIKKIHISISHSDFYAVGMAIGETDDEVDN